MAPAGGIGRRERRIGAALNFTHSLDSDQAVQPAPPIAFTETSRATLGSFVFRHTDRYRNL